MYTPLLPYTYLMFGLYGHSKMSYPMQAEEDRDVAVKEAPSEVGMAWQRQLTRLSRQVELSTVPKMCALAAF